MPCSLPGCTAIETIARGLCRLHYQRLRYSGTTAKLPRPVFVPKDVPFTNASALPTVGACASCATRGHIRPAPPRSCPAGSAPSHSASATTTLRATAATTTTGSTSATKARSKPASLHAQAPRIGAAPSAAPTPTTPRATTHGTTAGAGAHTAPRPAWARLRKEALRASRSTRPGQRAVAGRPPHDRGGWDACWPANDIHRRPSRRRGVLA